MRCKLNVSSHAMPEAWGGGAGRRGTEEGGWFAPRLGGVATPAGAGGPGGGEAGGGGCLRGGRRAAGPRDFGGRPPAAKIRRGGRPPRAAPREIRSGRAD